MSDVEFFPQLEEKSIFHVQLMATRLIRITLGDEMYGSNIQVFLNKFGVFTVSMGFMTSP
jgi:hypothetical protein